MKVARPLFWIWLLWLVPTLSTARGQEMPPLFQGSSLENWEITDFRGSGKVSVEDGKIILEAGETLTGITWKKPFPRVDYEVHLEAMRVSGQDIFCGLTFPVLDSFCSLIIGGWGGSIVGISSVDGWDASDNPTTRKMYFKKNQWYQVRLRVTADTIRAWIDGEPVVDLDLRDRHLTTRPDVWASRPFGLVSWRTTAAIRNIRLERIGADH